MITKEAPTNKRGGYNMMSRLCDVWGLKQIVPIDKNSFEKMMKNQKESFSQNPWIMTGQDGFMTEDGNEDIIVKWL